MLGALDMDSKLPGPSASSATDPTWAPGLELCCHLLPVPHLSGLVYRGPGGCEDWRAARFVSVLANTPESVNPRVGTNAVLFLVIVPSTWSAG